MRSAMTGWPTEMSGFPRRVLSTVDVVWTERGQTVRVRAGSVVDIPPGSALETAYGGPGNLEDVSGLAGSGDDLDKAWLAN